MMVTIHLIQIQDIKIHILQETTIQTTATIITAIL